MGAWLNINGEGIFETTAAEHWKEGDNIRFTQSKDGKIIYAFSLTRPGGKFELKTIAPAKRSKVYMLGYKKPLKWTYKNGLLSITIPPAAQHSTSVLGEYAWAFKIEGTQKTQP